MPQQQLAADGTRVLAVVRTGREVHRRMLTYTLNTTLKTFEIVVFLTVGLLLTGGLIVSPTLIVLLLFTNDSSRWPSPPTARSPRHCLSGGA